ncbi:hypothetical protein Pcinc_032281 [Petrolisthes cinctipes]|uniref:Uncharacterized protein n=1 Tax=Petrolisthes cinctipes TaxID=88211 RepID=A0AAE1EUG0_PETCI|nr:hypothetical protein Pcinc_032281 [Petrolisthes cinctipes]
MHPLLNSKDRASIASVSQQQRMPCSTIPAAEDPEDPDDPADQDDPDDPRAPVQPRAVRNIQGYFKRQQIIRDYFA